MLKNECSIKIVDFFPSRLLTEGYSKKVFDKCIILPVFLQPAKNLLLFNFSKKRSFSLWLRDDKKSKVAKF
jgi:hypothetical protein